MQLLMIIMAKFYQKIEKRRKIKEEIF